MCTGAGAVAAAAGAAFEGAAVPGLSSLSSPLLVAKNVRPADRAVGAAVGRFIEKLELLALVLVREEELVSPSEPRALLPPTASKLDKRVCKGCRFEQDLDGNGESGVGVGWDGVE